MLILANCLVSLAAAAPGGVVPLDPEAFEPVAHGGPLPAPGPPPPPPPPPPTARQLAAGATRTGAGAGGQTAGNPGAPATGGGTGARPATGRGVAGAVTRRRAAESTGSWEAWWALQRDGYLRLPSDLDAATQTVTDAGLPAIAADQAVQRRAMPLLLQGLRHENAELAAACLMTLARALPESERPAILAQIHKMLPRAKEPVRSTALVALGVLGDPRARPMLLGIASDSAEGRKTLSMSATIPCHLRSLAALSLGLLESRDAADELVTLLAKADCDQLRSSLLLGASLCAPHHPLVARTAQRYMLDRRVGNGVRAQAATALSRMQLSVARSALHSYINLIEDEQAPREVQSAALLALGRIADPEDTEAIAALRNATATLRGDVRGAAWIALGRLLERDARPAQHAEVRHATLEFLLRAVSHPDRSGDRPWAALAAGLAARGEPSASPVRTRAADTLLDGLRFESNPNTRAALALGVGLSGEKSRASSLLDALEQDPRGLFGRSAAQALALLGAPESANRLEALVRDDTVREDVRNEAVRALSAMGRTEVLRDLGRGLQESNSLWLTASFADALAASRRLAALDPLIGLLADAKQPTQARALAARALGDLAEPGEAWFEPYSEDANWLAEEPVLAFVLPQ